MARRETVTEKVATLKAQVTAARDEFDMAIAFHRTWRPCAYDNALLERMGTSFASNTFVVVRTALQRETLMALARIWDTQTKAVRMDYVRNALLDDAVIKVLADEAVPETSLKDDVLQRLGPFLRQQMKGSQRARANEAIALIDTYRCEQEPKIALASLKLLRNRALAHRQIEQLNMAEGIATDEQVDRLMADMTKLVGLLSSIVLGVTYSPDDTAQIYDRYAAFFWASAKGERTEGHPNFRPPDLSRLGENA